MQYLNRCFHIVLRNDNCEHRNELLREFDGKTCTIIEHFKGPLYRTNIAVTDLSNNDYSQNGFLIINIWSDGVFID